MTLPPELATLQGLGFRVEESTEIIAQGHARSAAYLVAEEQPDGYSFGLAYRPGLSGEQLASLSAEVLARVDSLLTEGANGPHLWVKGVHVPGYYVWLSLHDFDSTLDM